MTIYEEKEVTIKQRIAIKRVCDICGAESQQLRMINHHHNYWENNSVDSHHNIEICDSPECYRGAFKKFQESDNANYDTAVFDDMEYENLKMLLDIK